MPKDLLADRPNDLFTDSESVGALSASVSGIGQGLTLGFGDELMAAIAAPLRTMGRAVIGGDEGKNLGDRLADAYTAELENQRSINERAASESPVAFTAGEIAGGVMSGGAAARGGLTFLNAAKPSVSSIAGRGAAEGAIYGGLYGAGTGEGAEGRISQAGQGAALGAVGGGVIGSVGGIAARRASLGKIPTTQELKAAKDAAYKAAEDAGQVVPAWAMEKFSSLLEKFMLKQGVNLGQHPKSAGALDTLIKNSGEDISLSHIDLLRRNIIDAAMGGDPSEARMAGIMLNKLDSFVDKIPGGPMWRDARTAHKTFRKATTVERLIERARDRISQYAASGWDNALQAEFRQFVRNDKLMKGFTKEEKSALRAVANDGLGVTALRKLGKLAPSSGVIPLLGNMFAVSTGNPMLLGGALAAEVAKQSVVLVRKGRAKDALRLMQKVGGSQQVKALSAEARVALGGGVAAGAEQAPSLTGDIFAP